MEQQINWRQMVVSYLEMLIGTALTAASFGMIIVPQGFAAGGITGLGRILQAAVPFSLSQMVFALNMLLLVIGLIFVGKAFVAKTVAVSVLFPVLLEVFSQFPLSELGQDAIVSALTAGIMLGVGAGLVIRSGASSGGFDILAVILNRKVRISVAAVMNICDATVIMLQAMDQPILDTAYGIMVITVSASFVGRVVSFGSGESKIMIFSEHYETLRNILIDEVDVGLTYLDAETGFQNRPMKAIVSVVPCKKINGVKRVIMSVDPTAFVVVDQVHSVLGRGYTLDKNFEG